MWADSLFSRRTRTSVSKIARPIGAWVNAQSSSVSSAWRSRWWSRRSWTVTAVTNHWVTVPSRAGSGWACSHTSRPCPSRWHRTAVPLQLRPSARRHRAGRGSGAARRSATDRPTTSAGEYPSRWGVREPHAVTVPCASTPAVIARFTGRSPKRSPGMGLCAPSPSISPPVFPPRTRANRDRHTLPKPAVPSPPGPRGPALPPAGPYRFCAGGVPSRRCLPGRAVVLDPWPPVRLHSDNACRICVLDGDARPVLVLPPRASLRPDLLTSNRAPADPA